MTDDQRWDTITQHPELFPNITVLKNSGTYYPNAFVPNSLCCPSRTSTLTGTYSHTTGVYGNDPLDGKYGGFDSFNDSVTIATALQDSGYRTLFVGKYLNGYPAHHWNYVPPGWDEWFSIPTGSYYDYYAADNSKQSNHYGYSARSYSGRVLTDKAVSYVSHGPVDQPFFMYYAPAAPHSASPSTSIDPKTTNPNPDPRDVGKLNRTGLWRPPSYGNMGVSRGSPNYIKDRPWNGASREHIDLFRQRQYEALIGVDRNVGTLMSSLPANTDVIFMSDNGYLWGEHRWPTKQVPYDEAIRIPLLISGPGFSAGVDSRLALNVDIAPTLLTLAGLPADTFTGTKDYKSNGDPVPPEGLSLLGPVIRNSLVLEHWDLDEKVLGYCGVRTVDGWMYARYSDTFAGNKDVADEGFEEAYDLNSDPFELNNLAVSDPTNPKIDELRVLTQTSCDPAPPFYSWS